MSSVTSPDRRAHDVQHVPECTQPVTSGWPCATLVALPPTPGRWTSVLDQQRVPTETPPAPVALEPVTRVCSTCPLPVIGVFDRASDATWWWGQCSALPLKGVLVRVKRNRCVCRTAPDPTDTRGAPRKDGDRVQPTDPTSHRDPAGSRSIHDAQGRPSEVTWWQHVHLKDARWLDVRVLRVVHPHATTSERDPRVRWGVWSGEQSGDPADMAVGSVRRVSQDQGDRFKKQAVIWATPRLRTPEQCERCSQIVAVVQDHLVVARDLVEPVLHPWESTQREPTPHHMRRGIKNVLPPVGTPARSPQPRGPSPGRAKGVTVGKAQRVSILRTTPQVPPVIPQ